MVKTPTLGFDSYKLINYYCGSANSKFTISSVVIFLKHLLSSKLIQICPVASTSKYTLSSNYHPYFNDKEKLRDK